MNEFLHMSTGCAFLPGTIEEGIYLYADYPDLIERWARSSHQAML